MTYINSKDHGIVETIDQFDSRKEARLMLKEYMLAYPHGYSLYISTRSTKEWRGGP